MSVSAQENEELLITLFSPGTIFIFDEIEYESKICAKPRAQGGGGEPIADMYLEAKSTKDNVDNLVLKISLKKIGWEFIKNHMQRSDFEDVFFTESDTMIQNYLNQARELVREMPVIDLGGGTNKIIKKMGDGAITLGWEMMITNRNRGLAFGILERQFVREAILGEHIEDRRLHAVVNGNIIHNSGIPTHVLEMNLDENTTRENVFQTMITSEEFVRLHQEDLRVILKANNYRSLSSKTSSGRCDNQRYLFIQNKWSVDNSCLKRELVVGVERAFESNVESRLSLENALEQLGIDIRNVNLQNIPLCDSVPENHQ